MFTSKEHHYHLTIQWTGNTGTGTSVYRTYDRSHTISGENKATILASSDPAFRGDISKYNPEELLVAALSGCHMLSFLHKCADAGVVVTAYSDSATGTMIQTPEGGGHFTEVTLNPMFTLDAVAMIDMANSLHHKASQQCFIAGSVNFPVHHHPVCIAED